MLCYDYKGFKLTYLVHFDEILGSYEAKGTIILNESSSRPYVHDFATHSHKSIQAVEEIKKLMEQHVDFEWNQVSLLSNDEVKKHRL